MTEEDNDDKDYIDSRDESVCTGVAQHVMWQAAKQQEEKEDVEKNNKAPEKSNIDD